MTILNNNGLTKHLLPAMRTTLVMAVLTGLLFPALVYALAHLLFPDQAEGSFVRNQNRSDYWLSFNWAKL